MQNIAQYALPATVLASALGAIVLCLVLFLCGFPRDHDEESLARARRLFALRIGHAVAATCFAAVAMLGAVAWFDRRSEGVPRAPSITRLKDDAVDLESQVEALEERLAVAEERLAAVGRDLTAAESRLESTASASSKPAPATARRPRSGARPASVGAARREARSGRGSGDQTLAPPARPTERESTELVPGGPAASAPSASPAEPWPVASTEPQPARDLGTQIRDDWQLVKRGVRDAGKDLAAGLGKLGRRVRSTFGAHD